MSDIFDEVSEDLRAERAKQWATKYAGVLVAAMLLLVAGIAGWQAWHWYQVRQSNAAASGFLTAMRGAAPAASAPDRTNAEAEFAKLAAQGPEGYRTLARLRGAALRVSAGDLPGALGLWDQVSADTAADPLLRDLANLLWVQHQVDAGDPPAVLGRLAPLIAPGNAWRPMALESQAWLLLRTGKTEEARGLLSQLSADATAPDGVRSRASALLARMGETAPPPSATAGAGG